jgi:hypothetical protein
MKNRLIYVYLHSLTKFTRPGHFGYTGNVRMRRSDGKLVTVNSTRYKKLRDEGRVYFPEHFREVRQR